MSTISTSIVSSSDFLSSQWVRDCVPMEKGNKISYSPVLGEKKNFDVKEISLEKEIEKEYWDVVSEEAEDLCGFHNWVTERCWFLYQHGNFNTWKFEKFARWEYISEETWEYHFPLVSWEDRKNIPFWAIMGRLGGITPKTFRGVGFSKREANEIFNQFVFNYTNKTETQLLDEWKIFKENLPEELEIIKKLNPGVSQRIISLWKKNPDSFFKEEKIRENGEEFILPKNMERVNSLVRKFQGKEKEFSFTGKSVESLIHALEEFLLPEDTEEFPEMGSWPSEFKKPTKNPKEIYRLGVKYRNCLRVKAFGWGKNSWVSEFENVVFEF